MSIKRKPKQYTRTARPAVGFDAHSWWMYASELLKLYDMRHGYLHDMGTHRAARDKLISVLQDVEKQGHAPNPGADMGLIRKIYTDMGFYG